MVISPSAAPINLELALQASARDRIAHIRRDRWIPHRQASRAFRRMALTMEGERLLRPLSFLLWGPPNSGKSAIIRRFVTQRERDHFDTDEGIQRRSLLKIECPEEASPVGLLDAIADTLDPSINRFVANNQRAVRRAAYEALRLADCRAIAIDNINNFAVSRGRGMAVTLNAMRGLTAELQLSFLCAGKSTAHSVLKTDPQLIERFAFIELKAMALDGEFPSFVRTLVGTYPLRRSRMLSDEAVAESHAKSQGFIGRAVILLSEAAVLAVETGEEAITPALLQDEQVLEALESMRLTATRRAAY